VVELITPVRVLVVEDCEDDYDLLVLKLRQTGFDPLAARVETIGEIKEALAQQEWQIVFSDFDLPGFDGLRALELVRTANSEIPFFIVSGVIDEEQAVAALKAGAQDFFFKGKLARLGSAVRRELDEAEQRCKRREQQTALDRDRNILRHDRIRFIDVMSHELRTPLNIVNVAAGMLARYGERMDAAARQEHTSEIQEAVARMTRVIDKVLLTSRLELHRWELTSETFDLAVWCVEFLANNTAETDHRRVRLRVLDLPPKVAMDSRVLEIALQNLLSNALKYSPPLSPVDLEIRGIGLGQIEFTVRDCGIGIPKSDLSQVLDSFYRASNVGDVQGTGLGLAIVKGCADLHGGTLKIESEPGRGTCVTMRFPDWLHVGGDADEATALEVEVTRA
jgi:signal transduction histidine kinase